MKFSFINPQLNESLSIRERAMTNACPPLGISYIASVLNSKEVEVSALDQAAVGSSIKEVVDWVMKEDPDILGISTLLSSSFSAPKIAKEVKIKNPGITIVFGNHHATFNAERILKKYQFVDVIIRGEGEQTCLELVSCLKEKRGLKDVFGITFRHNNRIVSNPDRPLIKDIDSIPFPDRDLFNVEYHNSVIGINVAPKKFTSFLSSRGCPFTCRFCSCSSMACGFWRPRSIENILEELHLIASEGYEQIMFVDDVFTLNQKRVIKLCRRMREEKIDLEWISEGRVDQCSSDMLREMVKAGCRMMYFGIESANQKALDFYNKRITPKQSERAVANARKAGVDVIVGSFIVGAPNENKKDIQKTLDFTLRLGVDIPQINPLYVNPGTMIWEEFKEKGLLNEDKYWETGVYLSDIHPDAVSLNVIKHMIKIHYQSFLSSPQYIIRQILHTIRSPYRINIVFNNLNRIGIINESINRLYDTNS